MIEGKSNQRQFNGFSYPTAIVTVLICSDTTTTC
jgi:hypothetical protein